MTDADVDGSSHQGTVINLFLPLCDELIENGYIYIAQPAFVWS